jgi:DNA-binding MarR family transcriptional regulator
MERIVKGIWIPIEIWEAQDLSWNEKILLMEIDSFTTKGKDCFISDEYISELLGVNLVNANRNVSSLIKKGYIKKTRFDGRRRYLESLLCDRADLSQTIGQTYQERQPTYNNIPISEDKSSSICNKAKPFDFLNALGEIGVSEPVARDWMKVRKGKKASNTETAFKSIEREILKSGRSAEECITIAVENSWSGFKAEWLLNQQQRQTPPSGKKSVLQNNMEVAEQLMRMANIGEYE